MYKYILALLLLPVVACSQSTINVPITSYGSTAQSFVYLPDDYGKTTKTYPLMVFLHGSGEGVGTNISIVNNTGLPQLIKQGMKPYGIDPVTKDTVKFIIVAPFAAASKWSFQWIHWRYILPYMHANYRTDKVRVIVSGLSAGGYGTWHLADAEEAWMKENVSVIVPVSAAEVEPETEKRLRLIGRAGIAVEAVMGTGDSHLTGALRYRDSVAAGKGTAPNNLYQIAGGHNSSVWNQAYDVKSKIFGGQNLYSTVLKYKIGNPAPTTPPVVVPPVTPVPVTSTRKYIIPGADRGVYLKGKAKGINPGDTLVARASDWKNGTYFSLDSVYGTPAKPVVIINEGGPVNLSSGFGITNCTDLKITGSGSSDQYGFAIKDFQADATGPAVSITRKSKNIEVERVFINHKEYGFWIKNEADCDVTLNYPNWTIDNIKVHDCYIRQMDSQGFYMGSTDPNNLDRSITCDGVVRNYAPTRLGNIKIYNNIIDSAGRPGIQLSGAMTGDNEIYGNKVSNTGLQKDDAQGTGISLGGYTRAYVHDNDITNTFTWGIASLGGSGLVRIENNRIDKSSNGSVPWASNIAVSTRTTSPVDSTTFVIRNNIVGSKGINQVNNIEVDDPKKSMSKRGNLIDGNKTTSGGAATVKVEAGIVYSGGIITPPSVFTNIQLSKSFTRNNCPSNYVSGSVIYTVAAGKYSASSQDGADSLARNDIDSNGQAYANANGTCIPPTRKIIKIMTITVYDDGTIEVK